MRKKTDRFRPKLMVEPKKPPVDYNKKKLVINSILMLDPLRQAGLPIKSLESLNGKHFPREECKKKFSSMEMKDKALMQSLAKDYANIFIGGFALKKAGCETYYPVQKEKVAYCFTDLKLFEKAAQTNEMKITQFRIFYESIEINSPQARAFFVSSFKGHLSNGLRPLFNQAIRGAHKST